MRLLLGLLIISIAAMTAAAQTPLRLWDGDAPNALGKEAADIPVVTPYLAPKETATGAAVLICPGGGYSTVVDVKEGSVIAEWLNSIGVTAFVLKYRVGPRYGQPNPMLDAARAMRLVRHRAKEWNVDPKRLAIMGFSAGGHLASTIATHFDAGQSDAKDPIDRESSRPDLQILVYPVITMGVNTHGGSRLNLIGANPTPEMIAYYSNELQVKPDSPPAFIVHTIEDQKVPYEHSLKYAAALSDKKIPFELHIFEKGPHGFGLAKSDPVLSPWTAMLESWLRVRGFVAKKQ